MAKPLTHFLTVMEKSKGDLDKAKKELAELDTRGKNLQRELANFKVTITVPVRHNLSRKRTVCFNSACSRICEQYHHVCYDGCDITAPDEVVGHSALESCNVTGIDFAGV